MMLSFIYILAILSAIIAHFILIRPTLKEVKFRDSTGTINLNLAALVLFLLNLVFFPIIILAIITPALSEIYKDSLTSSLLDQKI